MTDYLVGTGGWAYFKAPSIPSLRVYSEVFNFVEVNYTFYEYPDTRMVERWRRTVSEDFVFAVRCHQDLTHRRDRSIEKQRIYLTELNSRRHCQ